MIRYLMLALIATLTACGGGDPEPEPLQFEKDRYERPVK